MYIYSYIYIYSIVMPPNTVKKLRGAKLWERNTDRVTKSNFIICIYINMLKALCTTNLC
jgi:hypothetical protein